MVEKTICKKMQVGYMAGMKNIIAILTFVFIFPLASAQAQQNLQLIDWFAGADIIGVTNSQDDLPTDFNVREFELSAYSQIDHIWEGSLTLALHKHTGTNEDTVTEIHEAFIFSNQFLPNTSFKLGRFFLGFGRLNRFHRHDWAISEAPQYHNEFFGFEAVKDDGVELSKLLSDDFYLKLTVGITSGKVFKETHSDEHVEGVSDEEEDNQHENTNAHVPTHYFRLSTFSEYSTQKGMEYALSYIGRTDSEGVRFQYYGIDLIFKNKFRRFYKDLLQIEAWQRQTYEHEGENYSDIGGYLYYEKGFDQNHALGVKLDWYRPHNIHAGHDEEEDHESHGLEVRDEFSELSLVYSYYNSEFMRVRASLSHSKGIIIDEEEVSNTKFMLQTVFMIGAHPAHLY